MKEVLTGLFVLAFLAALSALPYLLLMVAAKLLFF